MLYDRFYNHCPPLNTNDHWNELQQCCHVVVIVLLLLLRLLLLLSLGVINEQLITADVCKSPSNGLYVPRLYFLINYTRKPSCKQFRHCWNLVVMFYIFGCMFMHKIIDLSYRLYAVITCNSTPSRRVYCQYVYTVTQKNQNFYCHCLQCIYTRKKYFRF